LSSMSSSMICIFLTSSGLVISTAITEYFQELAHFPPLIIILQIIKFSGMYCIIQTVHEASFADSISLFKTKIQALSDDVHTEIPIAKSHKSHTGECRTQQYCC
jgi:hypothetical protein